MSAEFITRCVCGILSTSGLCEHLGAAKEQPMSDTLQEREDQMDQHQVNQSGVCTISGCPCRGWSAQEGAEVAKEESMNTNDAVNALKEFGEVVEQMPSDMKDEIIRQDERERLQEIRAASHQPAARGGGDAAGLVPATVLALAKKNQQIYDTDLSNALVKAVEVAHAEHQSLVAERERLITAAKATVERLNDLPRFLEKNCTMSLGRMVAGCLADLAVAIPPDQKRGAR